MLSELYKLFKLIWRKKKMLWLQILKIFVYSVVTKVITSLKKYIIWSLMLHLIL